ncbi:hypothetical protein MXD63_23215 [Frankia sp. Cpl3]|uniref:hypothetical protein n=1 Tax=Parafrankia colletiae TaxID=573497 RepID=UPI00104203A3|nr:hypothetical protein [Parafrankia colletiae]MCK9902965.1 hypothetical protein [Frankia sp. Cpl3]
MRGTHGVAGQLAAERSTQLAAAEDTAAGVVRVECGPGTSVAHAVELADLRQAPLPGRPRFPVPRPAPHRRHLTTAACRFRGPGETAPRRS